MRRIDGETPKQRGARLEQMSIRQWERLAGETLEQRESQMRERERLVGQNSKERILASQFAEYM